MPENILSSEVTETHFEKGKDRPELSAKPADKRPIIYGVIAAVVVILFFLGPAGLLFWGMPPERVATLRDITIIYISIAALIVILLLVALVVITTYLVLKVRDLVQLLDREIKPVLNRMQETMLTVRGTATFLSDHAIEPVITTVSTVSAVKAIFRSLFRRN